MSPSSPNAAPRFTEQQLVGILNRAALPSVPSKPSLAGTLGELITTVWRVRGEWHKKCGEPGRRKLNTLTHEICNRLELFARDLEDVADKRRDEAIVEGLLISTANAALSGGEAVRSKGIVGGAQ